MSCTDVRDLLPDHLLAALSEMQEAEIRRHLRGCSACRNELAALEEGLATFSQAHRSDPPAELETRVLAALEEEWRESAPAGAATSRGTAAAAAPRGREPGARSRFAWLAAAAAVVMLAGSLAWGLGQARRADRASAGASSYSNLLATLGGTEFRVGSIEGTAGHDVRGSVVVYHSVWDHSWGALFVRTPGASGTLMAALEGRGQPPLEFGPIEVSDGEGYGWLVTDADVRAFDRLTIRDASDQVVGTARIAAA